MNNELKYWKNINSLQKKGFRKIRVKPVTSAIA